MSGDIEKHLIVHERCIYHMENDAFQDPGDTAVIQEVIATLESLKDQGLPTAIVNQDNVENLQLSEVSKAQVLIYSVSGRDFQDSGAAAAFTADAGTVKVYGAFEEICVRAACDVLEELNVAHEIVPMGTIRLYDDAGGKHFQSVDTFP